MLQAPRRYRNSRAIWDHTVLPATWQRWHSRLYPQPIKAGTRFSDRRGMQGWVDLVGLVTYRSGISAQRRSPIPVLTGLNVEQLCSCDERRYHSAKPTLCVLIHFVSIRRLRRRYSHFSSIASCTLRGGSKGGQGAHPQSEIRPPSGPQVEFFCDSNWSSEMKIYWLYFGFMPKTAFYYMTDKIFPVTGSLRRPLSPSLPP